MSWYSTGFRGARADWFVQQHQPSRELGEPAARPGGT